MKSIPEQLSSEQNHARTSTPADTRGRMSHGTTGKWISAVLIGMAMASSGAAVSAAEVARITAAPVADNGKVKAPLETAVFAGGCFWGIQGMFEHVRGVRKVVSGYSGGDQATASYEVVSSGKTAHAESVQITFDPVEVSYGELLHMFFSVADRKSVV